ncbi:unnamed protein product [Polarella glacialis]|uniref:Uncharacterized protein n=1 Tax=Polarella glacialis TaxID=89957 RepID=A0A813F634_POLGL|nr:unnamed protein product [Polarella glacialis]
MDPNDRRHLCQITAAADAAYKSFTDFTRDFGPMLSGDAESQGRLKSLEAQHALMLQVLLPCRELVSEAPSVRCQRSLRALTCEVGIAMESRGTKLPGGALYAVDSSGW